MLFLKVTKSVKSFAGRFGWLIAELVFVFMGLYGAFLLERMHDEDMDLLRKRQILQALIDEFENYESELGSSSKSMDEAYGSPFFSAYGAGERPFPKPIPYGGMGSVNTGIWEAMLQSGGIEVLEVEDIQKVQMFFKKIQDLLDLYSRFERLSESMILPEMDQEVGFFYQKEGSELRDKYKWYVNSLFTIGLSLRDLSAQASETKEVLLAELERIKIPTEQEAKKEPLRKQEKTRTKPVKPTVNEIVPEPSVAKDQTSNGLTPDERIQVLEFLGKQFQRLGEHLGQIKLDFDHAHAIPFFNSYGEGENPLPYQMPSDLLESIDPTPLSRMLANQGMIRSLSTEEIDSLGSILVKITETKSLHQEFYERCREEIPPPEDLNSTTFYSAGSTELRDGYLWFPNTLLSLGMALEDCQEESLSLAEMLIRDAKETSMLSTAEFADVQTSESNQTLVSENEK
jgi:hypothetical protein